MSLRLGPVLIGRDEISKRVSLLAGEIATYYGSQELFILPVLTGSFVFCADLVRQLPHCNHIIRFVKAGSYGSSIHSSGKVSVNGLEKLDIEGKNVLIVEDIIDTGLTLSTLLKAIKQKGPKDVKVAVLLDKPSRRKVELKADFTGFEIEDKFVVGFGLDCNEQFRCLPDIHIVSEE